MGWIFMVGTSLLATFLFIFNHHKGVFPNWLSVLFPLIILLLIIINYLRFTRFVSWLIFGSAFFGFLVVLSAFTLRWRNEPGFNPYPFYRTVVMYVAMVYVSLAQIKILGNPSTKKLNRVEVRDAGEK